MLEQLQAGKWVPVAFFSKSLHKAKTHYSAFDRELLALYLAIKCFYFLEGHSFTAYTDHKPLFLTFAISGLGHSWSPCQSRHLSYIAEFTTDIWHIIGKQNVVVDTLSRAPVYKIGTIFTSSKDFVNMAILQDNDSDIQAYCISITGLCLQEITIPDYNRTLLCDVSMHSP